MVNLVGGLLGCLGGFSKFLFTLILNYQQFFSGKKITLMGLGLLGRGVGDAQFLAKCASELVVTDLKPSTALRPSLAKLRKYKNIKFVLGGHRLEDFRNRDLIIKAAGVPLVSPFITEAKKNKIPVRMSTALFAKFAQEMGVKIIGITGTRGKTTTTKLIHEILREYFGEKKVHLGGNIQGLTTLPLLEKIRKDDLVVLELDSWQLQGFGDLKISPNIAVFTNFMADHLNYYGGSMKKYFADKANIFKYQNKRSSDKLFWGGKVPKLPKSWKLKLPGEHNRQNFALAVAVARELEIPEKIIKQAVESFSGVAGRLELVRTWQGIKIYNDTTATTPDATLVALKALSFPRLRSGQNPHKLVLILGGADKTLDMSELIKNLDKFCRQIILLPGSGTEKIKNKIEKKVLVKSLAEAVKVSLEFCEKGDTLLFSPAFASFGMFKNEYDRGAQFDQLVKKLK
ncbi:MAG: Mur ligase family protein [Patescibacteria group bacterium]